MEQKNEIVLRDRAMEIVANCKEAKNGTLAERTKAIAEGVSWIAQWEALKLIKQMNALAVVMKRRGLKNG